MLLAIGLNKIFLIPDSLLHLRRFPLFGRDTIYLPLRWPFSIPLDYIANLMDCIIILYYIIFPSVFYQFCWYNC